MENQTTPTTPSPEPATTPQKTKISLLTGMIVLVLILLASTGYLAFQNYQLRKEISQLQASPSPTPVPISGVPNDWTSQKSTPCNLEIAFPPKKEPYYIPEDQSTPPAVNDEGSFWQFREDLGKLFMFDYGVTVIFSHPEAASGYIPAAIDIFCSPNKDKLNTAQLNYQLDTYLIEIASGDPETSISLKSTKDSRRWGKEIKELTFTGGMFNPEQNYYLFATTDYIYLITKIVQSPSTFVKETADKILDSLKFLE